MDATERGNAIQYPVLYKALLQNELSACFLAEAALILIEALARQSSQSPVWSDEELSEAQYYAYSVISSLKENQQMLEQKLRLARFGMPLYVNVG